jgi:hypothetical protein
MLNVFVQRNSFRYACRAYWQHNATIWLCAICGELIVLVEGCVLRSEGECPCGAEVIIEGPVYLPGENSLYRSARGPRRAIESKEAEADSDDKFLRECGISTADSDSPSR